MGYMEFFRGLWERYLAKPANREKQRMSKDNTGKERVGKSVVAAGTP